MDRVRHQFIRSGDVRLRVQWRAVAAPSGPPVVLIHGMAADHRTWRGTARALRAAGRPTVTFDQRGHGGSDHSPDYLLDELAADAERVIDGLGLDRFDVVGHSLGGQTALRLAWRRPDAVRRLVLEEMPPLPQHPDQVPESIDAPITPRRVRLAIKQVVQSPAALLTFDRTMMDSVLPQFAPDPVWWNRVSATPQPALVISGGPIDFLKPQYLRLVADALPLGQFLELGGGHTVHREAPARFQRAVLDFLV
ncbi:Alpha/beta hydrolase fold protein OS=Tsukamurella paurometabola (strain ATCC 8368 / DSM / CCUG 35730 / CIP 100753 / JCM 10117 / KCTC 9821 / NBRC 16120 /NCIMB 702349 / NCTC 13040) OX=521096 GN=Tpau_3257 PE=4 SV=1 [Tsukamurella paurometabola]|uniref:Alpha/beta hydrolase fold protein n=1 Tax=Tsukamurella paurometabola (strain ATCC 8368 / DSM 20162 / CCUG 35730 / CIP 100753 / JCM 10117 / KCTC 9821 / NBRC 16120 / NCIMB 702349 / NCTC 13040) TaxID=521096 RepID=D5UVR0_TSUPD|nr:alpha/beta hydrolase fold protein [Tsukamurella paurometabola DSM 20162]SUP37397.1 Esterase ybfF [Tsukamurella paurometabola]